MTRLTVIRSAEGATALQNAIVGRRSPGARALVKTAPRRNLRRDPRSDSRAALPGKNSSVNTNSPVGYGVTSSDAGTLRLTTLSRHQRTDAESSTNRLRGPSQIATAPSAADERNASTHGHTNGSVSTLINSSADPGSAGSPGANSAPATPADLIRSEAALIERVRPAMSRPFPAWCSGTCARRSASRITSSQHREDAEDAVQQAFMAALARIDSFDITRPFGPWFARVVLNHARSARRRGRVWPDVRSSPSIRSTRRRRPRRSARPKTRRSETGFEPRSRRCRSVSGWRCS